jgi:hypothetical protein
LPPPHPAIANRSRTSLLNSISLSSVNNVSIGVCCCCCASVESRRRGRGRGGVLLGGEDGGGE